MPNVKSIINKFNKTVLDPPTNNTERTCNCMNSEKCLTNNIMYKATITSNQNNYYHKIYYGITETKFKQGYANHIKFSQHEKHQRDTELSNEYETLKTTTTAQLSYGNYFENSRRITLTPKDVPCV